MLRSIGGNATRAHGRCQQAFLDAATQQNLTFLVQVRAPSLPPPLHPPSRSLYFISGNVGSRDSRVMSANLPALDRRFSMSRRRLVLLVQGTEAGNLVNGLPNFARPTTVLAPINSAFYNILTGTGEHAQQ